MHRGRLIALGTPAEVKQLMPSAILEVRASNPRQATALLREKLVAESVGLFGDRVHVTTANPDAVSAQVQNLLAAAGLKVEGVRRIEPGLEDIFVSVLAMQKGGGET
jgi:ABC-2 type transport system ATP-binding protein